MKKLALGLMLMSLCFGAFSNTSADELMLPVISVEPGSYDFGEVPIFAIASGNLLVRNLSPDMSLVVTAVKTKAPFANAATAFTIPPLGSRRVKIGFMPSSVGNFSGPCTFLSNAANAPVFSVPLSGEGVAE